MLKAQLIKTEIHGFAELSYIDVRTFKCQENINVALQVNL